jgi:hypothetical protein
MVNFFVVIFIFSFHSLPRERQDGIGIQFYFLRDIFFKIYNKLKIISYLLIILSLIFFIIIYFILIFLI